MKYLVTNPDSFGDMVLRQPLLAGLLDAGHDVGVLVKRGYSQIVHFLDPRLRIFMVDDLNPYVISILDDRYKVDAILAEVAAEFDPDVIVVAPYQRTLIDNWTLDRFPDKKSIGMGGIEVDYENGLRVFRPVTRRVTSVLLVPENLSEVEKNRRLLALCLGKEVPSYQPQLHLPPATTQLAREMLNELQLKPRSFIVCTLGSTSLAVKQYPKERYVELLAYWSKKYDRQILLVGNQAERTSLLEIQAGLNALNIPSRQWIGDEASLEVLLGMIWLSKGYFGNDTGPMHFAAALDKPVLAIFGGGTWPRFVPAAGEGAAIVQELPCFGCGWQCVFDHALCIHGVREEWVIHAIDQLETGQLRPFTILSNRFEGAVMNDWIVEAKDRLTSNKAQIDSMKLELERQAHISRELTAKETALESLREELRQKDEQLALLAGFRSQLDEERKCTRELQEQLKNEQSNTAGLQDRAEEYERSLAREREAAAIVRRQLENEQINTAGLKGRVEEYERSLAREREAAAIVRQQLTEQQQFSLAHQKQLLEEREVASSLRRQLDAEQKSATSLRIQLAAEQSQHADLKEQSAKLREQLTEERRKNSSLSGQLSSAQEALEEQGRRLSRVREGLIDLKPAFEELHLAIRQQDVMAQRFEERLLGVAHSGWTRLGVRIGIPFLSKWYAEAFTRDPVTGAPVVEKDEFDNPLSIKAHLMKKVEELSHEAGHQGVAHSA